MLNNHQDFILSPITDIISNVVSASAGLGGGIETFPLCDYIMQSVFLKMTGAQEQKTKIIAWELATHDYEYRYYRFTQKRLGECSNYSEKNAIYKDLVQQIKSFDHNFNITSSIDKGATLLCTKSSIENIFLNSNLLVWIQNKFLEYQNIWNKIEGKHFANDDTNLFTSIGNGISLQNLYKILYKHRNRIAHNTLSYQQNLPTLETLKTEDYRFENYFLFFSILILIDYIFIKLYQEYLQQIENI